MKNPTGKNKFKTIVASILNNGLFKGSFLILTASMFGNVINYLYHLLMGRMLGPIDYGILASLISLSYILGIPSGALNLVIVKFVSSFQKDKFLIRRFHQKLMTIVTRVVFFGSLVLLLVSPLIAKFLHLTSWVQVFWVSVSGLIGFCTLVNSATLYGLMKFSLISLYSVLSVSIRLVLTVFLVFIGWKVFGATLAFFLTAITGFLITRSMVIKHLNFKAEKKNIETKGFTKKEIINYSIPVFFSTLAFTSLYTTDIVLVKHFLSPIEAGYYASLATLGKIVFFASSPIASVMFPMVSKAFEEKKSYKKISTIGLLAILTISIGVIAVYLLAPKLMISLLYGKEYLSVAKYLPLFAVFIGFYSISSALSQFFLSIKKTKIIVLPTFAALVQIVLITIFHQSLLQIVLISIITLGLLSLCLSIYYLFSGKSHQLQTLSSKF